MSLSVPLWSCQPLAPRSYSYPQVDRFASPDKRGSPLLSFVQPVNGHPPPSRSYPQVNGRTSPVRASFCTSQVSPNSPDMMNGNHNQTSGELTQRYDITGVTLGAGKHSEVVQVRRKNDGQSFAAKIIPLQTNDEIKVDREIRTMAKFKHQYSTRMVENIRGSEQLPNVRAMPPYICIVMNQIDGEPLTATLFQSGANPSLAWKLLFQIGSVLRELHNQQLAHRDIWSENILFDRCGDFYLIDYGCAESTVCPSALAAKEGLNLPYLSPQTCMKQPPSTGDDMWALGLVLTELVTGQHIIRRMGSNNAPFFLQKDLFQAALDETAAKGGQQLGNIAKALLSEHESQRATASDLLAMVAGQQQMYKTPSFQQSTPDLQKRQTTPLQSTPDLPKMQINRNGFSPFKARELLQGAEASGKFSIPISSKMNGYASSCASGVMTYPSYIHNAPSQSCFLVRSPSTMSWIV